MRCIFLFVYTFDSIAAVETAKTSESAYVQIKTVQTQNGWVSKGRLQFERVYGVKKKKVNLRYPYHRKVCT